MIPRHKTAIRRPGLSLPVRCVLRDNLLAPSKKLFDYGCGYGQDIDLLTQLGFSSGGWDPAFRPDEERISAHVVNLGYVINVIEDAAERAEVLRAAWELCEEVLVVSALRESDPDAERICFGDGVLTSRGTFQKHYLHAELRAYLQECFSIDPVSAAPNVFYLFKSEEAWHQFHSRRYRRALPVPKQRLSERLFEQHKDLLGPLMSSISNLGRLPYPDEVAGYDQIEEVFGSLKRAFQVVARVTGREPWAEITAQRKEDLIVYLALARFGRRRPLSQLPIGIQRDIRAFEGTYRQASDKANALLFSVGDTCTVDEACRAANIGHLIDNALVVLRSDLERLSPALRVFEGCARAILGVVDEANIVKLHRYSGKVSYLVCKDIKEGADPEVSHRVKVNLRTLDIDFFDYSDWETRPRLGISPLYLKA